MRLLMGAEHQEDEKSTQSQSETRTPLEDGVISIQSFGMEDSDKEDPIPVEPSPPHCVEDSVN